MRDRRDVLRGGAGLVVMGIAGCVERERRGGDEADGDDGGEDGDFDPRADRPVNDSSDGDADDGETDGNASETGEASFTVASSRIPETVEIGSPAEYRVTIVNDGTAAGRFTSPVSARPEGGEWTRIGEIDLSIQAHGEGIYRGAVTFDAIGRYELRIDALDETYRFVTSPKQLEYGTTYRAPNDVEVTVEDVFLRGSYPYYDEDDEVRLHYARRDRKYAVAAVTSANESAFNRRAPPKEAFVLVAQGNQYNPIDLELDLAPVDVDRNRELAEYSGGRIYTGVTRSGLIFYDVPDSVNANTATKISFNDAYDGRRISVTWHDD